MGQINQNKLTYILFRKPCLLLQKWRLHYELFCSPFIVFIEGRNIKQFHPDYIVLPAFINVTIWATDEAFDWMAPLPLDYDVTHNPSCFYLAYLFVWLLISPIIHFMAGCRNIHVKKFLRFNIRNNECQDTFPGHLIFLTVIWCLFDFNIFIEWCEGKTPYSFFGILYIPH